MTLVLTNREGNIAWSMFRANEMSPKHKEIQIPARVDCPAAYVTASPDSSPPQVVRNSQVANSGGACMNIFIRTGGSDTSLEDSLDFIATDFENRLQSGIVGKGVDQRCKRQLVVCGFGNLHHLLSFVINFGNDVIG
jgi:hypothetical protein